MAITNRVPCSLAVFLTVMPALAAANTPEQAAPSAATDLARVRSGSPRLAALIEEAARRSLTFRRIVAALESTDGIVFISEGECLRGVPACLAWRVTVAGPYRLLFVTVDSQRRDVDVMASAGHELQHALEVLSEPGLRTGADVVHFYMRGRTGIPSRAIETRAAVAAGDAVLREVQRSRSEEHNTPSRAPLRTGPKLARQPGPGHLPIAHDGIN